MKAIKHDTMTASAETSPLLQADSAADTDRYSDMESRFSERRVRQFLRQRFWWFCLFGVAAVITLQLFFLPRTSLSRDFRRWHDLHLTNSDAKRIYLAQLKLGRPDKDGLTNEEHIGHWLRTFSAINAKNPTSLAGTPELAEFVEAQMRSFGFLTQSKTYPILTLLHVPTGLLLELLDAESERVLYSADLLEVGMSTPAFFTFGQNGSISGEFLYVHSGTPEDFDLLEKNGLSPNGKIVIFAHTLESEYLVADKVAYAELLGCKATVVFGDPEVADAVSRNYKPGVAEPAFRLPVSYRAIKPILTALGPASGDFSNWKHAPVPELALKVHIATEFAPGSLNATNIIALMTGIITDGEIIIGASRDTLTSSNPLSGHAIMFEIMRGLQNLRKLGWRPLRTIRFVSWDASRSGLLGSVAGTEDTDTFKPKMPTLAYINLDEDVVTGSHFTVDGNPLFNHVVRKTARFVAFPKSSPFFHRLEDDDDSDDDNDGDDEGDDDETSLYHYWHKQDKATIHNKLGSRIAGKDAATFQFGLDTPTINVRFTESPTHNDSVYVPESNFYSYEWLTKENVDSSYDFHGLLVRFVGLLVLSLGEREVVYSRTRPLFNSVQIFYSDFERANKRKLKEWDPKSVHSGLVAKYSIYADTKVDDESVTFEKLRSTFDALLGNVVQQAKIFDDYNDEVEDSLTQDYAWYKMLKKVHIYAKFKVSNYKLLRIEKEMALKPEDSEFLGIAPISRHFMYEVPRRSRPYTSEEKDLRAAFASMYEAVESDNFNQLVKLLAVHYERLKSVYKRIT